MPQADGNLPHIELIQSGLERLRRAYTPAVTNARFAPGPALADSSPPLEGTPGRFVTPPPGTGPSQAPACNPLKTRGFLSVTFRMLGTRTPDWRRRYRTSAAATRWWCENSIGWAGQWRI
jgi:hypothetical protein